MKSINDQVINVRLDIRELNTKLDMLKDLGKRVDVVEDIAKEALISTQSAHHRLNEMKGEVQSVKEKSERDTNEVRTHMRWLIGTTLSVIALFLTALGFLWKMLEQ